jgi:hypothetical protein
VRFLLFVALLTSAAAAGESLEEQFVDPPREYSIVPLWSWNGTLDPERLRWQMDQMVDKGVYGAFMHARAGLDGSGTPYFSDGWWRAIQTCIDHGNEVGFSPWIYDEDKWPSGAAGGRTEARNPERNVQKALRRIEKEAAGPADIAIDAAGARIVLAARRGIAGALEPQSFVDITAFAGKSWSCPEGNWLILAYVPFSKPGHVNYMNAGTVRDFLDITHEEYAKRAGANLGTLIPGVFFDEIANDAGRHKDEHPWTEEFESRFRAMKGYELAPLLPALTYDIGPRTPIVRCDYYDVYATLYEEAWFKQIAGWCDQHGIELTGHTIEPPRGYLSQGDYFRTMRHLQIPMTDHEDFRYTWPRTIRSWMPKQVASVAHLYDRPRAGAEAMGGASWAFTPDLARYGFNMLSAYGVDFFAPHLFHYALDRPENMDDWPNSWFVENPYWKYFKTLADLSRRTSFMMSGADNVVEAAVLYPQTNQWAGYGSGTVEQTVQILVESQVDVDVLDPPSLLRAELSNGALSVGKMRYKALVLPGVRCIRRAEADKLRKFVRAGGTLIVHDRWPTDSMEQGRDDAYLRSLRDEASAMGVRPCAVTDTAIVLRNTLDTDVRLIEGDPFALRYRHVRRDGKDIYWFVNGGASPAAWRIDVRATGHPTLWQPEDGTIEPMSLFTRSGDRTAFDLQLDARQGRFAVFDSSPSPQGGLRIVSTNLLSPVATNGGVQGLLPAGETVARIEASLVTDTGARAITGYTAAPNPPEAVALDGDWEFIPVGHELDYVWKTDIQSAELELPVMRTDWERDANEPRHLANYDDRRWREIKVFDSLHPEEGARRYRSRWQGRFITFNDSFGTDIDRFFFTPTMGGKGLRLRTAFDLPSTDGRGRLAVVCESPFRVEVNGVECATAQGGKETRVVELSGFRQGSNTLVITADDAKAVLAEGEVSAVRLFTDNTWEASLDGKNWLSAWEYVAPPEAPYAEPVHPFRASLPHVVWYRQALPPGTAALRKPEIEGACELWIEGAPVALAEEWTPIEKLNRTAQLALRVQLREGDRGLLKPLRFRVEAASQPLQSWTQQGLEWYSGRAIYRRDFSINDTLISNGMRLYLELGKVRYCAEIWLNGQPVTTRIWPPYRADITKFAKPGVNRLEIVVANLLANRMRWDIFDDARGSLAQRKWHDDMLFREAQCLESGLLGPVRVLPCRPVTVSLAAR